MEKLEAVVESIVYRSDDTGYTVAEISVGNDLHTAVGTVPQLAEGTKVLLEGDWVSHPVYGSQFKISALKVQAPDTQEGVVRYLASGVVPGVGPVTAQRIVETFGMETLEIIRYQPGRLTEVEGIGLSRAQAIAEGFAAHYDMQNAMVFLQSLGISTGYATRIYKAYGARTEDNIKANPYQLVDDIDGVGFKTADRIAQSMGIDEHSLHRVKAAMLHMLREAAGQEGHTCLPEAKLFDWTAKLLESAETSRLEEALARLAIESRLVLEKQGDETWVWLPAMRAAEREVAMRLMELTRSQEELFWDDIGEVVDDEAQEKGIMLAPEQRAAVVAALEGGVSVITGGPGTGKTTCINCLIGVLENVGLDVSLCAPTGRAAKRMTEATAHEAKTVHRLLEYGASEDGEGYFKRDDRNPLDADAIIVDETSMLDILLTQKLLKAIRPGCRLILVGDADQLPSVGPGNVLKDIISSGVARVVRLQRIYRQAEKSLIITNAHKVNQGQTPELRRTDSDFFFERKNTAEEALNNTIALVTTRLPKFGNYDPLRDIQVLTPTRKGELGVASLNTRLQQAFNPPSPMKGEHRHGDTTFRVGDKVMQVKNNYSMSWRKSEAGCADESGEGVFNGDMGFLIDVDKESRMMTVRFDDGRECCYEFNQAEELALAYAVSIHKSQGSEFPVVVLPLVGGPPMLLTRNLLYTAITRARKMVVLTGREDCIADMVANNRIRARYSGLGAAFLELGELAPAR